MLKTFEILHYFAENEPPLHPKDTKPLYNCAFSVHLQASKPENFPSSPRHFFFPRGENVFPSRDIFRFRVGNTSSRLWYLNFRLWNTSFRVGNEKFSLGKRKIPLGGKKKNFCFPFFFARLFVPLHTEKDTENRNETYSAHLP